MNEKHELIIKIVCFIILINLNILIIINGLSLSCDKCAIHFKADKEDFKEAYDMPVQDFYVNISDLYMSYINNRCYVYWSRENGFQINDL
jgi:hypothetical protein